MTNTHIRFSKIPRFGLGLLASALVLVLDQASKSFMKGLLADPLDFIPVTPFFSLVLGFNRGISFGLLGDLGSWGPVVLSSLAVVIVGFLLLWLWKAEDIWDEAAIALIIGGALGNLLDRLNAGAVTDFLDFYIGSYHWPAFNLADTGIAIGAGILIVRSFHPIKKSKEADADEENK